jgi:lipopolysaccharide/colanic/teichoic acid biosynthesis glycosyltransferase
MEHRDSYLFSTSYVLRGILFQKGVLEGGNVSSNKSRLKETFGYREYALENDGLANSTKFQALVRQERCRADRGGKEFSLVIFEVNGSRPRSAENALVTARIREEMRSIDEIGWIDETSIGALLLETKLEGGRSFAHRVSQKIPNSIAFSFKIFCYPANWVHQAESEWLEGRKAYKPPVAVSLGPTAIRKEPFGRGNAFDSIFCPKVPVWKRALDFGGAFIGFTLLSPLMLLVAAYIKIVSRGPVLFRQERLGRGGKVFTFLKFRTMKTDNNESYHKNHILAAIRGDGTLAKLDDRGDPRIIPGGRTLRRSCLDELPQLINVLRGEMSLVGPRPCLAYEAAEFLRWHTHRFDSMPGLTGLWQVSGKNKLTFSQMIRLDISYAEHMSLWLDLRIILMTFPAIGQMILESLAKKIKSHSLLDSSLVKTDVKVVPH